MLCSNNVSIRGRRKKGKNRTELPSIRPKPKSDRKKWIWGKASIKVRASCWLDGWPLFRLGLPIFSLTSHAFQLGGFPTNIDTELRLRELVFKWVKI